MLKISRVFSKSSATIGVGAGTFLEMQRFLREFPQTSSKNVCGETFTKLIKAFVFGGHTKYLLCFFARPPKRSSCFLSFGKSNSDVFRQSFSFIKQIKRKRRNISAKFCGILPGFSEILPGLSTNQNFLGCAFTPCSPTPLSAKTCDKSWVSPPGGYKSLLPIVNLLQNVCIFVFDDCYQVPVFY